MISIKYKDLETNNIIDNSEEFYSQFHSKYCPEAQLEDVKRLIYIIEQYIITELNNIAMSVTSYSNYYRTVASQPYTADEIENGVKTHVIHNLNDIYTLINPPADFEFQDREDIEKRISGKLACIMQEEVLGESIWVTKELNNQYLNPMLHCLGVIALLPDEINYYLSEDRFPQNYDSSKINNLSKDIFSNIKEAMVRNLEPTKIEDFTTGQRVDLKYKSKILEVLNKTWLSNITSKEAIPPTNTEESELSVKKRVRFPETINISEDKKKRIGPHTSNVLEERNPNIPIENRSK